ncbi:MAG: alpha/beta hydrolase domain-containing protein [Acidimicrobiia bacterium]
MGSCAVVTIGPALDDVPSLFSVGFDLASVGYSVHEHFVSGTASGYVTAGRRAPDGHWQVKPSGKAMFTTRLVVYRPTDPARSNGTVIVEWLNVTGGLDVPALWMATHRHLVRDGYTWVGLSAQHVGIHGGGVMPGLGLRDTAPERYHALDHPGDVYSFDIFTQVGHAIRAELASRYGLRVDRVLATGASQSACYLTTYVNAIDARDAVFDGFLLQGRAGAGVPIDGWDPTTVGPGADVETRRARLAGSDHIREDVRVPVMVVQSETDVLGALASLPARQPDNQQFRLWEVAGAAHCDTYFLCASSHDSGSLPVADLAALIARADRSGVPTALPINSGPQMHYVLQRAFDALDQWTRDGSAPVSAAWLEVDENGTFGIDDVGVVRGGVRTPWVDAPTNILSGLGQPGHMTDLFGTTRPLDPTTLTARYPHGRDDYLDCFRNATHAAIDRGFLIAADGPEIEALGAASWSNT